MSIFLGITSMAKHHAKYTETMPLKYVKFDPLDQHMLRHKTCKKADKFKGISKVQARAERIWRYSPE